jgi:hypothetical protein
MQGAPLSMRNDEEAVEHKSRLRMPLFENVWLLPKSHVFQDQIAS